MSGRDEGRAALSRLAEGLGGMGAEGVDAMTYDGGLRRVSPASDLGGGADWLLFEWQGAECEVTWNDDGTLTAVLAGVGAQRLLAALAAMRTCDVAAMNGWDADMGVYTCSCCGALWQFDYDGPAENGWACCPRCRASIGGDRP